MSVKVVIIAVILFLFILFLFNRIANTGTFVHVVAAAVLACVGTYYIKESGFISDNNDLKKERPLPPPPPPKPVSPPDSGYGNPFGIPEGFSPLDGE